MNGLSRPHSSVENLHLKLLVVIASYGPRNMDLLVQVIERYQRMTLDIDIVVVSNDPKDLGPDIDVVVGLPSKNPWSLPFAHKTIFAQRLEEYDYFVYSEDDIGVTENNLRSFFYATPDLFEDEIAGFLRYELDAAGERNYPDFLGRFHWKPESVRKRGKHVIAEFSNEHAAFYILTRQQLCKAMESGGFLREPYEDVYDLACTAATDPYTSCGFRKVICVSSIQDFTVHHLSNRYAGKVGISSIEFDTQIHAMHEIAEELRSSSPLLTSVSEWPVQRWAKDYYGEFDVRVVELIPGDVRTLLSIGSSSGDFELELKRRGFSVTACPLDAVIGSIIERQGIELIAGSFDECLARLRGRHFDCVIVGNFLHIVSDSGDLIRGCAELVRQQGFLLANGPNFRSLRTLVKRALNVHGLRSLKTANGERASPLGPRDVMRDLSKVGFRLETVSWLVEQEGKSFDRINGPVGAAEWALRARATK